MTAPRVGSNRWMTVPALDGLDDGHRSLLPVASLLLVLDLLLSLVCLHHSRELSQLCHPSDGVFG